MRLNKNVMESQRVDENFNFCDSIDLISRLV